MTVVSYAQNLEDIMLWRAFRNISKGFYIDIGANDPILHSVSNLFYQHGWRGIHIEPCKEFADSLQKARPDEIVKQIALSDHVGEVDFYEIPSTGLSTMCPNVAEQHEKNGFTVHKTRIVVDILDNILTMTKGDIHWLKIDVEGAEKKILKGWKENPLRPWVLIIESTLPLTQVSSYTEWEDIVIKKGYEFAYFDGLNRFYVYKQHSELKKYFTSPVNVFDDFVLFNRIKLEEIVKTLNDNINNEQTEKQKLLAEKQKLLHDKVKLLDCKKKLLNDKQVSSIKIHQLQKSLADRQKQLELTSSKINALLVSRSWRITAFLRWTAEYLRQLKQKNWHSYLKKYRVVSNKSFLSKQKINIMNWFSNQISLVKRYGFKSRYKAFIKKCLRFVIGSINKHPKTKFWILKASRSMGMYNFLCRVYHKTITVSPVTTSVQEIPDVPIELSIWSARIYREIENKSDKEVN